jgi:hypothetical protein
VLRLWVSLFNVANAPAGFVVDRRKRLRQRSSVESLQSRQKFLKVKPKTKSPEFANVARVDLRPLSFERSNEFRKNHESAAVFTSDSAFPVFLGDLGQTAFSDRKDPLQWGRLICRI